MMRLGKTAVKRLRTAYLMTRIWLIYARVVVLLGRRPLHQVVDILSGGPSHPPPLGHLQNLSLLVHKTLRIGSRSARCLPAALVLLRLLRGRGYPAELVIGLGAAATNHIAHAWVEVDGQDVGPPPGQGNHLELARYPTPSIDPGRSSHQESRE